MNERNANQMIFDLMRTDAMKALDKDAQKAVRTAIVEIVQAAKLEVIEDAEKAISKLRVFSLR